MISTHGTTAARWYCRQSPSVAKLAAVFDYSSASGMTASSNARSLRDRTADQRTSAAFTYQMRTVAGWCRQTAQLNAVSPLAADRFIVPMRAPDLRSDIFPCQMSAKACNVNHRLRPDVTDAPAMLSGYYYSVASPDVLVQQ